MFLLYVYSPIPNHGGIPINNPKNYNNIEPMERYMFLVWLSKKNPSLELFNSFESSLIHIIYSNDYPGSIPYTFRSPLYHL